MQDTFYGYNACPYLSSLVTKQTGGTEYGQLGDDKSRSCYQWAWYRERGGGKHMIGQQILKWDKYSQYFSK